MTQPDLFSSAPTLDSADPRLVPGKTTGDLIRQLRPYFESSYNLNIAVNNYRRTHGSKNWVVAATDLLSQIEKDIELWTATKL